MRAVEQQMLQDGLLPLTDEGGGHAQGPNSVTKQQEPHSMHSSTGPAAAEAEGRSGSESEGQEVVGSKSNIISDYLNLQLPPEDPISAASRVVSLGSFSKIMAPGLRLG
eukprot:GHUV01055638.1.p1 GENE.GHUV01055638.1~~GHUV01055638.1.p1  ORF type:complete len:109 (+),score=33.83 GHUV01055638.1:391-717(+)